MSYQNSHAPEDSEVIDVTFMEVPPTKRSILKVLLGDGDTYVPVRPTRQLNKDYCRAMLTKSAIEHIGALSTEEQYLLEVAPQGAARYKAIIDAYTKKAIKQIERL